MDWEANEVCKTHKGGEVPDVVLNPNKQGQANLMIFSDVHFGQSSFNHKLFQRHIDLAKDLDAYIILAGDMLETALPSHIEQSVWEADLTTGEQYKTARKWFEPLKDRIIFSISGNHDLRVWKKTGFDIAERLAEDFKCFYSRHGGYVVVNLGRQTYKIYVAHGHSASTDPFAELMKRFNVYDDADIMAMGNNHQLMHRVLVKKRLQKGKEVRKLIHLVRTGGFLSEPDYSRQALYAPTVEGCPVITLNSKANHANVDVQGELRWE